MAVTSSVWQFLAVCGIFKFYELIISISLSTEAVKAIKETWEALTGISGTEMEQLSATKLQALQRGRLQRRKDAEAKQSPPPDELEGTIDTAAAEDAVAKMDTDGDGKVDATELAAATGVSTEDAAAIIETADQDGDGKLDAAELAAAS